MDDMEAQARDRRMREFELSISGVAGAIDRMHSDVGRRMNRLDEAQRQLDTRVTAMQQELTDFIERNAREMSMLTAIAKLVDVRAELDRRFGQYRAVRRNAHGLLLAMDHDLAEDATTTLIAESMTIDAGDYWLAAMINAAAAWLRDEQGATQRALLRALELDRGKSALYAGLLNARYRRLPATDQWLTLYLEELDATSLPSHFVVVLDAAIVGALGIRTREKVGNWCMHSFHKVAADSGAAREQVARWTTTLQSYADMPGPAGPFATEYPVLDSISTESVPLAGHFQQAQAFRLMHQAMLTRRPILDAADRSWKEMIDRVLENLTGLPEPEERKLRGLEQDYLRVVDHEGDTALAKRDREAEAPLDRPRVDLLSLLTNLAQRPDQYSVSPKTIQLARHLSVKPIVQAVRDLQNDGRQKADEAVPVRIQGWEGKLRHGPPDEKLVNSLGAELDRMTAEDEVREQRRTSLTIAAALVVAGLALYAGTLLRGGAASSPFALIPLTGAFVAAIYFAVVRVRTPERVARARENGRQRKAEAISTLRAAMTERNRLHEEWSRRLDEGEALLEHVETIDLPQLTSDPVAEEEEARSTEAALAEMSARSGGHGPRLPRWNLTLRAS